jgi:hypothetical protein
LAASTSAQPVELVEDGTVVVGEVDVVLDGPGRVTVTVVVDVVVGGLVEVVVDAVVDVDEVLELDVDVVDAAEGLVVVVFDGPVLDPIPPSRP